MKTYELILGVVSFIVGVLGILEAVRAHRSLKGFSLEDETLDAEGETNVIGDVENAVEDAAEGVAETSDGAVDDIDKEALADKTSEAITTNTQN